MKFSFVIPTVNQYDMLFECIDTLLYYNGYDEHEVIVVDDGSPLPLQKRIAAECENAGITFIAHEVNSGFARTVNAGIRASTGDIVVLVNNDILFTEDMTAPLTRAFATHPSIGVVGALLYYPTGAIQHGGMISTGVGRFEHRGHGKRISERSDLIRPDYCIAVTGAIFAIKRNVIEEVGLLNEEYFLACEDSEYCLRVWSSGYRVLYSSEVTAIHLEGGTRGATDEYKRANHNKWYLKELETAKKFQTDVTHKYASRWYTLVNHISYLNRELHGATCDEVHYGGGTGGETTLMTVGPRATKDVVLVKRMGALGDVILTTGVVRAIKERSPNDDIWVMTGVPEVYRGNPYVSRILTGVDETPPTLKHLFDLDSAYEKTPKTHILEVYGRCLPDTSSVWLPELYSNECDLATLRTKLGHLRLTDKLAIIHASVGWPSRTLPQNRWNEVVNELTTLGYTCAVIGRGADYRCVGAQSLVGTLNIHEIRELMKCAQVFVGMDSGMMHVAFTTNIPIVALFTVANPAYRVVARQAKTIALIPKIHCRFCLHEEKPPVYFIKCKYNTNACLNDFDAHDIVDAVKEVTVHAPRL